MAENEITYTEADVKFRFSNPGSPNVVHDVVSDHCWDCGTQVSPETTAYVSRINGDSRFGYEPCCEPCEAKVWDEVTDLLGQDAVESIYELEAQYAEQSD